MPLYEKTIRGRVSASADKVVMIDEGHPLVVTAHATDGDGGPAVVELTYRLPADNTIAIYVSGDQIGELAEAIREAAAVAEASA